MKDPSSENIRLLRRIASRSSSRGCK